LRLHMERAHIVYVIRIDICRGRHLTHAFFFHMDSDRTRCVGKGAGTDLSLLARHAQDIYKLALTVHVDSHLSSSGSFGE